MSGDIIIVVPPGTRVRYVEAPVDKVMAIDADWLTVAGNLVPDYGIGRFAGLPVHDVERKA